MNPQVTVLRGFVAAALVVGCGGSASPTASPATAPTATPSPSTAATCVDAHGTGTFQITPDQSSLETPLTMTFPGGWTGCGLAFKGQRNGLPAMMVGFWRVGFVYPDPCQWRITDRSVGLGPTVQDALAGVELQTRSRYVDIGEGSDARIDGQAAQNMEIEVPLGIDLSACDRSDEVEFRFWDEGDPDGAVWWIPARAAPGLVANVYFLEVGGERVAIQTVRFVDAPEPFLDVADELAAIVDSIDFQE